MSARDYRSFWPDTLGLVCWPDDIECTVFLKRPQLVVVQSILSPTYTKSYTRTYKYRHSALDR